MGHGARECRIKNLRMKNGSSLNSTVLRLQSACLEVGVDLEVGLEVEFVLELEVVLALELEFAFELEVGLALKIGTDFAVVLVISVE
jgi:hypothetical protein